MDRTDQHEHEEFLAQYEQFLRANAAHEVIDAAELVVSDAWLRRLGVLSANAAQLLTASTTALTAATARMSEARDSADPDAIKRAQRLLAQVEGSCARNNGLCAEVTAFTQHQLAALTRARCAREARRRANAACLEAAARRATLNPTHPGDQ